ncbi:hypothetical protein [Bosea sp. PAMC 26642]|nr:hypothetical protein [Bosea sp. PAMC 26642]
MLGSDPAFSIRYDVGLTLASLTFDIATAFGASALLRGEPVDASLLNMVP